MKTIILNFILSMSALFFAPALIQLGLSELGFHYAYWPIVVICIGIDIIVSQAVKTNKETE